MYGSKLHADIVPEIDINLGVGERATLLKDGL